MSFKKQSEIALLIEGYVNTLRPFIPRPVTGAKSDFSPGMEQRMTAWFMSLII